MQGVWRCKTLLTGAVGLRGRALPGNINAIMGQACEQKLSHLQKLLCLLQEAQDILSRSSACSSFIEMNHHPLTYFRHHTRALKAFDAFKSES